MIAKAVTMLALVAVFFTASLTDDPRQCNGWYDAAAGACDSIGE